MNKQYAHFRDYIRSKSMRNILIFSVSLLLLLFFPSLVEASIPEDYSKDIQTALDTLWVIFSGCLVFLMNLGFLTLENGFTPLNRGININVIAKNLIVFPIIVMAFFALGFSIMFSHGGDLNALIGTQGWFLTGSDNSPTINDVSKGITDAYQGVYSSLDDVSIPLLAKFFFQLTFASTTATIVSGALIGRVRFTAFCLFSFVLAAVIYPICGHIVWGGGILDGRFWDFAGSTVVHSVGGWAAFSGAFVIGARHITETSQKMKLESAAIGCLILWVGWLGFNAGSTLELDVDSISHIIVVTILAGGMGSLSAFFWYWMFSGKQPSLAFIINGILGGCVSITAACRYVTPISAILIGFIGGIVIVIVHTILLRWKPDGKIVIDDPVGAIPVHLGCGVWGTFAVGLFAEGPSSKPLYELGDGPAQGIIIGVFRNLQSGQSFFQSFVVKPDSWSLFWNQILGIIVIGVFAYGLSYLTWKLLDFLYRNVFDSLRKNDWFFYRSSFSDEFIVF